MGDAATLVAIVSCGEVTPIHLIRYVEKTVFESRALLPANTLACARLAGVFRSPALRSLVETGLIKTLHSNQNTLRSITLLANQMNYETRLTGQAITTDAIFHLLPNSWICDACENCCCQYVNHLRDVYFFNYICSHCFTYIKFPFRLMNYM